VSAREGIGVDELRAEIARRVAAKQANRGRVDGDVRAAAERLAAAGGEAPTRILREERVGRLDDAFAEAAGVPVVVGAVERSVRARIARATAWPVVSWVSGIGPDPLDSLGVDLGDQGRALTGRDRSAELPTTQVQRARVDAEVRAVADDVSAGLARPWAESVHRASTSRLGELGDRLDAALAAADVRSHRLPWWAGAVRVLQWLLLVGAVAGLAWTGVLLGTGKLGAASTPHAGGVAVALVLLVGSVLLGVVLGVVGRVAAGAVARRRAEAADARLRAAVADVSRELVVAPVEAELAAYTAMRAALARALA
jgi:hypothetical protein